MSNFSFVFPGPVVRDLETYYGIQAVMQMKGASLPPIANHRTPFALTDGSQFQRALASERIIELQCIARGATLQNAHTIRRKLIQDINPKALSDSTFILRYSGAGTSVDFQVRYHGGLEGGGLTATADTFSIQLLAVDPRAQSSSIATTALNSSNILSGASWIAQRSANLVWSAMAASGRPAAAITAIVVSPDASTLYVAAGVNVFSYIAGAWATIGTFDNTVNALALGRNGTTLYAGGLFTTTVGPSTGGAMIMVARFASGVAWQSMAGLTVPGASGVLTLATDSRNYLYAGGTFTTAAGSGCNGLARWAGAAWAAATTSYVNTGIDAIAIDQSDNVFVAMNVTPPPTVDVLLVGGGGAGCGNGFTSASGGGGGGVLVTTGVTVSASSNPVVVGAGGVGSTQPGKSGGASIAFGLLAYGGGGGVGVGQAGGSGSGGAGSVFGGDVGGATLAGQGNAGGTGNATAAAGLSSSGGGGGAGAVGGNATATVGGAGGAGVSNSYSGAAVTYGGGGGAFGTTTGGAGGAGGGGAYGAAGTNALGGGGGANKVNNTGINGGNGIVIIKYPTASGSAVGGTLTQSGGNNIHTFTASDNFTTPSNVVRYPSTFDAPVNLATGTNGRVRCLTISPTGLLYAGGDFTGYVTSAGTQSAPRVASWNGYNWAAVGSGLDNGSVFAMALAPDGALHVAGSFTTAATLPVANAAVFVGGPAARFTQKTNIIPASPCKAIAIDKFGVLTLGSSTASLPTIAGSTVLTNPGDTDSSPVFTIQRVGGTTCIVRTIVNTLTGKRLTFDYPLTDGETMTIDLAANPKLIYSTGAPNLLGKLIAPSNLDSFAISPGAQAYLLLIDSTGSPTITASSSFYPAYWSVDSAAP